MGIHYSRSTALLFTVITNPPTKFLKPIEKVCISLSYVFSYQLLFISAPRTVLQEGKNFTDNKLDPTDDSRIWFIFGIRIKCHMQGHVELIEGYIGRGAK